MAGSPTTVPFHVVTHRLSFHGATNNWQAVVKCIVEDGNTDVWCFQATSARNLRSLPDAFVKSSSMGLAFVSRKASVQLRKVAYVNMAPLLVEAAQRWTAIADSLPVSTHHLRKLQVVVGLAAVDVTGPCSSGERAALGRILVVNADFERVRDWSTDFHSSLVQVLCWQVWGGEKSYTQQWGCRHVCFAGSFFFPPGSTPYMMLTSRSGGLRETLDAVTVVKPFLCCQWNKDNDGACSTTSVSYMCVVNAAAQRVSEMQELLGIRLKNDGAAEMRIRDLRVFLCCSNTGSCDNVELMAEREDGWWRLAKPLDTSATQHVMLCLQWPAEGVDENATDESRLPASTLRVSLLVRSHGVLSPRRQAIEKVRGVDSPLLSSVMAGTCVGEEALSGRRELDALLRVRGHVYEPTTDMGAEYGEPVITALYRTNVPILPGCYDYIFVSTYTGVTVESTVSHTTTEFAQEQVTAHLPLHAHLALPSATT
ncbi:hypothetical protein LSCM1_06636 [Leishmania martiniquensis]|uniref:Uncharacterized protein n=1 Tax=Leishmania martiniquensis TaxID=1580590 RepID=A0A836HXT1_9TRYP|nr:hypothetical protein LSCM1_06636 [Leishmania martiniquensis]